MIKELEQRFGSSFYSNYNPSLPKTIKWYTAPTGETFGIDTTTAKGEEIALLDIILEKALLHPIRLNEKEQQWLNYITYSDENEPAYDTDYFRFIHFSTSHEIENTSELNDIFLQSFADHKITIIWKNNQNGVIIEFFNDDPIETDDFEELSAALTADFFINVYFFIGTKLSNIAVARQQYDWEEQCFAVMKDYSASQHVTYYHQATPYLMLEHVPIEELQKIASHLIKEVKLDKELIKTIQVYFKNNLNTTLAAKELFMHRNTLQYRIDKFIEKTGIDIKHFDQAVSVYLALIIYQTL
ncbi:PucR family transcriptional regulator [Alkalihalobacterium elongatum]|uniref:PucR family transcriptional regulator n=1 Tax=Alkalihalobacterium elongatum TaxID=2675466 RepID=UPI001C1FE9EC|nr:helix-turn-helix domain-containing protein [Alkalihalobacterium elongatum]